MTPAQKIHEAEQAARALPDQLAAELGARTFATYEDARAIVNGMGGIRGTYMRRLENLGAALTDALRANVGGRLSALCDRAISAMATADHIVPK